MTTELLRDLRWVFLALIGAYTFVYAIAQWRKSGDGLRALRFLALCGTAFAVLFGYAIARPATESLFMESYGAKSEPYVWIVSPVVGVFIVGAYNRWSAGLALGRAMAGVCAASIALLAFVLFARGNRLIGATFALYIWKDFYIVFLVEIFWTYANAVYPVKSARWAYGLFCGWGAAGGYIGNLSIGPYAKSIGTENALWLVVPTLVIAAVVFAWASVDQHIEKVEHDSVAFNDGFRRVARNRVLLTILSLVVLSQFAVTLIDFRWKLEIQRTLTDTAERADAYGVVYGLISVLELALQLVAGPVLKLLGASGVLMAIPVLLTAGTAALAGGAAILSAVKVASKGLDYSLFRIAKEILYIPLCYDDKSRGKPVIDILGYRAAKGAISLLLIVPWVQTPARVEILGLAALTLWCAVTVLTLRRGSQIPSESSGLEKQAV